MEADTISLEQVLIIQGPASLKVPALLPGIYVHSGAVSGVTVLPALLKLHINYTLRKSIKVVDSAPASIALIIML